MKRSLVIVLMLLVLASSLAFGRIVSTFGNWDIPFNVPGQEIANDFHIDGVILSRDGQMPKLERWWVKDNNEAKDWSLSGLCMKRNAEDPEKWDFSMDFDTEGYVKSGEIIHFGFTFNVHMCNDIQINDAYWTLDGKRISDSISLLGFGINRLNDVAFDNVATMRNDMINAEVIVDTLEFAVTTEPVPLPQMDKDGLGLPGGAAGAKEFSEIKWHRYPEKIRLKPGESFKVDLKELGIDLKAGEFLQIRANNPVSDTIGWLQHQD